MTAFSAVFQNMVVAEAILGNLETLHSTTTMHAVAAKLIMAALASVKRRILCKPSGTQNVPPVFPVLGVVSAGLTLQIVEGSDSECSLICPVPRLSSLVTQVRCSVPGTYKWMPVCATQPARPVRKELAQCAGVCHPPDGCNVGWALPKTAPPVPT